MSKKNCCATIAETLKEQSFKEVIQRRIMTQFKPFCATYYDPQKISIGDVVAPPYDVISGPEQEKLYRRSPFNCVRLILNKHQSSDRDTDNRYTRARGFFREWCDTGILVPEKAPCFYLYSQKFPDPVTGAPRERFAVIGRLRLEPFEKGVVIPHEKTLAAPKRDRIRLLETVNANFSPIFGLYQDPGGEMAAWAGKFRERKPRFQTRDDAGVAHVLYPVESPEEISHLERYFSRRKIYIADGHHRYTTALEHSLNRRRAADIPAGKILPSDFVLTALVAFEDPGLVMEPTHRLISDHPGFDLPSRLEILKEYFEFRPSEEKQLLSYFNGTKADPMKSSPAEIGLVCGSGRWMLVLKDEKAARRKMPAGKPEFWYRLDVNVLSHFIFSSLWGWPESDWESKLGFSHSAEQAAEAVKNGAAAVSFLLKAPEVRILGAFGEAGELMPQKSTYFYPKLASGLVFYRHDRGHDD